jgi:hypothetical protein
MSAGQNKPSPRLSNIDLKWTPQLTAAGWTALPNVIFEYQRDLGLTPLDINILLHIVSHWWDPNAKPFPSKVTIAERIGVDPRTVQRRIAAMERRGLIRREQRRTSRTGSKTNVYHLDGLIGRAIPLAQEAVKLRAIERAARKARPRQKGPPTLHVVD